MTYFDPKFAHEAIAAWESPTISECLGNDTRAFSPANIIAQAGNDLNFQLTCALDEIERLNSLLEGDDA